MSKPTVYLAGAMSGLTFEQMNNWRVEAKKQLKEHFHVINPCEFYNFDLDPSSYTDREVKEFDLLALRRSDLVLVNLEYPNSIGTAIELDRAYCIYGIPVIAFNGHGKNVHSWITTSISKWCSTMDEAITFIKDFYVPILCGR